MTALPAAGYGSNAARTQGEMKTYFEDIVAFLRERGGAGTGWTNLASAATVTLGTQTSRMLNITGTTSITSFGTTSPGDGWVFMLRFAGILTLTNGANLILPGGANITTAANDVALVVWEGANVWRVIGILRANGIAASGGLSGGAISATGTVSIDTNNAGGVGAYALMANASGSSISAAATIAGSSLRFATFSSANLIQSTAGVPSGTWRNVSGFAVGTAEFGMFIRTV